MRPVCHEPSAVSASETIRTARRGDRDAVLTLWLDLVEHHRRIDPAYPVPSGLRATLLRELDRALRSRRCGVWVAEIEGRIEGFVLAEIEGRRSGTAVAPASAWIHELWVAPEWRGRGIGRALFDRGQRFLAERGVVRLSVRVVSGNRAGLRFWQRRGFDEKARILELDPRERP